MKKIFRLQDLECAHCAAKMEVAINKIPGVVQATVDFMGQKLVIESGDDDMERVLQEAQKQIKKIEPDCKILGL